MKPRSVAAVGVPPFLLPLVLLPLILLPLGCSTETPPAKNPKTGTATVVVNDGENETEVQVPAGNGDTVEEVLRAVDAKEIQFEITGSGVTAFVTSINGKATSASEGWIFKIDGEYSERGIGTSEIAPPVTISWTFGGMPE